MERGQILILDIALANNLVFDRCRSPAGSGGEIKYILVLTLPKLESKGERPVY